MVTKMNSYVQELQNSGNEKYNSQKNLESFSGLLIQRSTGKHQDIRRRCYRM
jgi:hypothetical protein